MSNPKKNLLEAFRSAESARTPPPPSAVPPSRLRPVEVVEPPNVGGPLPFTQGAAPQAQPGARVEERRRVPAAVPWGVAVLLAFVVGLALGRMGVESESLAANGDDAGRAEPMDDAPGGSPARQRPGIQRSSDPITYSRSPGNKANARPRAGEPTAALFDKANKYTVVVATYGASREDFALATRDHLVDEGIPVFPPYEQGKGILVLAGAQAKASELQALSERIRALPGFDGSKNGYADAYVERIDKIVRRP